MYSVKCAREFYTNYHGYKVPKGALYGKRNDRQVYFVCENAVFCTSEKMFIHLSNDGVHWFSGFIGKDSEITKAIRAWIVDNNKRVPKISTYKPLIRNREFRNMSPQQKRPQTDFEPIKQKINGDNCGTICGEVNPYCWSVMYKNEPQVHSQKMKLDKPKREEDKPKRKAS